MEPKKITFTPTDIQFHSRDFRPTGSLEQAVKKAMKSGSKEIRVYCQPFLEIDTETKLVYLRFGFTKDVIEKFKDGTLSMDSNTPWKIDAETEKKLASKRKRELKDSTRVWRQ